MNTEFAYIALDPIVPSLTNPRKKFDPAKLAELAESIKGTGVHQPILVRPLPGERVEETSWNSAPGQQLTRRAVRPTYELVCGERRYRASTNAGVATIPAMIRDLTNEQVREIQIIENLQRDDLTELEEAEGYEQLMQHSDLNADQVALKIGKSRSYVYARTKLLDLSPECKEAMRSGQIDASRALVIARIPDTALQTKALAEATRADFQGEVPSLRAFQSWLQANVMLRLENASFKITDTRLLESAGSCKECPKRTGANPDLFADVIGADICTDPVCFHAKGEAHRTAIVTKAESKGMRLIEGKEAKTICNAHSSQIKGYLPLSQVREDSAKLMGSMERGMRAPTLRELLGKEAPEPVLIENPFTKELIEAVPAAQAEAMLVVKGLIKATKQQAEQEEKAASEIEYLQSTQKKKTAQAVKAAQYKAVIDGIRTTPDADVSKLLSSDTLRAWLGAVLGETVDIDDMAEMLGYTFQDGLNEMDSLAMHIRACNGATLTRALLIHMAMEDKPSYYMAEEDPTILKSLSSSLKIDTGAIEKEAKTSVKAEIAQKIKDLQAELKANTAPSTPTSTETFSRGTGGDKPKTSKPATRKEKLTANDAISGIAAAMQGVEDQAATAQPDTPDHEEALYLEAVEIVRKENKASIALVQRTLKVGYNQAARLLEQMEAKGVVSAMHTDSTRTVIAVDATDTAAPPAQPDYTAMRQLAGIGLPIGTRVKALTGKPKGKEGEVIKDLGEDCFSVKFKGVSVAMSFHLHQLEVLA